MKTIPLAIALFTSTRGHFDVKTRYLETLDALNAQIPLGHFAGLFANIKVSPGEEQIGADMERILTAKGFTVRQAVGVWNHGEDGSHQREYLSDLYHMYNDPAVLRHQYVLHAEDDWAFTSFNGDLLKHFATATRILDNEPETMQVRFARFANEAERIRGLYAKHGINGLVENETNEGFRTNDFSFNPSVMRSRDLKIATHLFNAGIFRLPIHVEHGQGMMIRHLSRTQTCLAVLNPVNVKVSHLGTRRGEEDSITEPLNAN